MPFPTPAYAVIANGQTASNAVDLRGKRLLGVSYGTMTGTALTFTVSDTESGTYREAHNSSGAISFTIGDDDCMWFAPADARPANCFVKLVSGSAEGADRTLTLFMEAM